MAGLAAPSEMLSCAVKSWVAAFHSHITKCSPFHFYPLWIQIQQLHHDPGTRCVFKNTFLPLCVPHPLLQDVQRKTVKPEASPAQGTQLQSEGNPQSGSGKPFLFVPDKQWMEHGPYQGAGDLLPHQALRAA